MTDYVGVLPATPSATPHDKLEYFNSPGHANSTIPRMKLGVSSQMYMYKTYFVL